MIIIYKIKDLDYRAIDCENLILCELLYKKFYIGHSPFIPTNKEARVLQFLDSLKEFLSKKKKSFSRYKQFEFYLTKFNKL